MDWVFYGEVDYEEYGLERVCLTGMDVEGRDGMGFKWMGLV